MSTEVTIMLSLRKARENPKRKLVYTSEGPFGDPGMLPIEAPRDFAPSYLLAHDLIEHQPRDKGSLVDELIAFGVTYYIRWDPIELFEMRRMGKQTEAVDANQLAIDISALYIQGVCGLDGGLSAPYPKGPLNSPPTHVKLIPDAQVIRNAAALYISRELEGRSDESYEEAGAEKQEVLEGVEPYLDNALKWISFGTERAKRRYGKIAPDLLRRLYNAVNRIGKKMEDYFLEGHELFIEYKLDSENDYGWVMIWPKGMKKSAAEREEF